MEVAKDSVLDESKANVVTLIQEQRNDKTLTGCWSMAKCGKGNYFFKDGLLHHCEKLLGRQSNNFVAPEGRRNYVLKVAHKTCGVILPRKNARPIWFNLA